VTEHPVDQSIDEQVHTPRGNGVDLVEDVLAETAGLDARPVSEHVAVYEAAHDRLREALAHAAEDNRPT
jgi:hypothetical protein